MIAFMLYGFMGGVDSNRPFDLCFLLSRKQNSSKTLSVEKLRSSSGDSDARRGEGLKVARGLRLKIRVSQPLSGANGTVWGEGGGGGGRGFTLPF